MDVGPCYTLSILCEVYGWTDEYIFQLPYLRVAMHLRNIRIRREAEKQLAQNNPEDYDEGATWEPDSCLNRLNEPSFQNNVDKL